MLFLSFLYIYVLKKDQIGLIFLNYNKNCPEYSEFQDQRNDLAALDTRLTNAITGGDVAAPFTYDVKNSAYTDSFSNAEMNSWSQLTVNQIKTGGPPPYPAINTRTYSTIFDIKANYNLKVNLSVSTDYGDSTGYVLIMLLDTTSGATLYQRQVDLGATINESIPLSAFKGKKVRVALKTVKASSSQTSFVINCNIGSLVITNQ